MSIRNGTGNSNTTQLTIYLPNYECMNLHVAETSNFDEILKAILDAHQNEKLYPSLYYHAPEFYVMRMHEGMVWFLICWWCFCFIVMLTIVSHHIEFYCCGHNIKFDLVSLLLATRKIKSMFAMSTHTLICSRNFQHHTHTVANFCFLILLILHSYLSALHLCLTWL